MSNICKAIEKTEYENMILLGDFNCRDISWDLVEANTASSQLLLDCIQENLLNQLVTQPTRGESLDDLVITGNTDLIDKCRVEEPFSSSDHNSIHIDVKLMIPRVCQAKRKIYLYSKGNYEDLNNEVQNTDWHKILSPKHIEHKWKNFKAKYQELENKYIPSKHIEPGARHKPAWLSYKSVQRAKRRKRQSWIKARTSKLHADKVLHDIECSKYKEALSKAKGDYEDTLVNEISENPKKFYNHARHFYRSSSTIDALDDKGETVTEDTDKAELLNSFFASVLTVSSEPLHSIPTVAPQPETSIYNIHLSTAEVRTRIQKMKANKATGNDGIHCNLLRMSPDYDVPLTLLFNHSLHTGTLPQDWRDANITPLHKKGSRTLVSNYRPVSLTSQVCKLLEKLIIPYLWKHIKTNNIIHCNQHGFQSDCSCITQLLECLYDWSNSYDNKVGTDAIYLDFAKAFDTVCHHRLHLKLKHYGIKGKVLEWIDAFLSNRRQRVVLRNGTSSWRTVTSGVPQGSILGPLLFLIFVNDIPASVETTAKMFADDTKLYSEIKNKSDCDTLQHDLNILSAWSSQWLVRFNATKCVVLRIKQSVEYLYTLNGVELEEVTEQKDLGVTVSNDLKPTKHISSIVKKANQRTGMIRRCFSNLTAKKISILYQTIIRPLLEYASPVWSPWYSKDINLLEQTQKRCLKLSHEPVKLDSLQTRRNTTDIIETYKITNGLYKVNKDHFFKQPSRTLRGHQQKLFKPHSRTNIHKNFFTQRVVDSWNHLPENLPVAKSLSSFKNKLMRVLPKGEED